MEMEVGGKFKNQSSKPARSSKMKAASRRGRHGSRCCAWPVSKKQLHHSDRGVQYASAEYRQLLTDHGLVPSMSRKGNCYDNATMESFWGTLKQEPVTQENYTTRAQARQSLFVWIETYYNRVRLHSALGYHSPVDFENQLN